MSRSLQLLIGIIVLALLGGLGWGLFNALEIDSQESHIDESGSVADSNDAAVRSPRRKDETATARSLNDSDSEQADAEGLTPSGARDAFGNLLSLFDVLVIDADQVPIPDVDLELVVDQGDPSRGPIEAETAGRGQTDEKGRFVFQEVPSFERYVIIARHDDYATLHRGGLQPNSGEGREIGLQLLAGRSVSGVVADRSGSPVVGAVVTVYDTSQMALNEERRIERTAVSDGEGRYHIGAISRGFKNVVAAAEGYAAGVHSNADFSRGRPLRTLDFRLEQGGSIEGRVVDDHGEGIPNAIVSVQAVRMGDGRTDYHHPVRSDPEGHFVIDGLTEGRPLLISARCAGFAGRLARKNVEVGDRDVELVLSVSLRIRGRVVDDQTGAPITAFSLVLSPSPQLHRLSRRFVQHVFHEDGQFDFRAMNSMGVRRFTHLFALVPGTAGASQRIALVPDDQPGARPRTLIEGVELRVSRGAMIVGRVVDAQGSGIANARIEVLPEVDLGEATGRRAMFEKSMAQRFTAVRNQTMSLRDGSFQVVGVTPGKWRLRVLHEVYASMIAPETLSTSHEETVDAGRLVLRLGGHVWGRVRDSEHKPEEGAVVHLVPVPGEAGSPMQHRTDLTGLFDFRGVRPGIYHLSVTERKGISTYRSLLVSGQPAAVAAKGEGYRLVVDEGSEIEQDL